MKKNNKKMVLDLGCGHGFNTFYLNKKGYLVIGIDISKENIDICRQRYKNINFEVGNAEKLDFKDKIFDEIYTMDILEHVNDLELVINEIRRILKKRGKLIVNIPYYKSEYWLLKVRPTYFQEIHHVRIFKENELENFLKNKNFSLFKKLKIGFLQHFELYFLFKKKNQSKVQTGIGSWRDSFLGIMFHTAMLFFSPIIFYTPLKYIPIWIITLPIGYIINFFGNKFFPKSLFYEFIKNN